MFDATWKEKWNGAAVPKPRRVCLLARKMFSKNATRDRKKVGEKGRSNWLVVGLQNSIRRISFHIYPRYKGGFDEYGHVEESHKENLIAKVSKWFLGTSAPVLGQSRPTRVSIT